jgi:hypothetical protein
MIIHLFPCENSYSSSLLALLEKRIQIEDHLFVFGFGKSMKHKSAQSEVLKPNTIYLTNFLHLIRFLIILYSKKYWIFFHFLAYDPTLIFWRFNKKIIKKSTWIIWGGDLYAFQNAKISLRNRFYESCRLRIIPWFPEIASFIKEDADLAKKVYLSKAEYHYVLYPIPVRIEHLMSRSEVRKARTKGILLGNSADPSNRHTESLEMLVPFMDEDIEVYCPLSYGGNPAYIEMISKKGKSIFGEKFHPLSHFLNADDYAGLLHKIDIVIMNHQRQQGLGNILSLLYLGKKVYLRADTTSYIFLKRNNCQVFDVNEIMNSDFSLFSSFTDINKNNRHYAEKVMTDEYSFNLWSKLINLHSA